MTIHYRRRLSSTSWVLLHLWCAWFFHQTLCCVPTQGTTTTTVAPVTTTTTTTTTTAPATTTTTIVPVTTTTAVTTTTTAGPVPAGCCPALMQTLTSSEFPDGLMTFFYNNDTCRTMVTAVCSQTDPAFDLYAAIVANGQFFLDYGPNNISFPGTCNTTLQRWEMGTPPLIINTIECRLTNPPSGG